MTLFINTIISLLYYFKNIEIASAPWNIFNIKFYILSMGYPLSNFLLIFLKLSSTITLINTKIFKSPDSFLSFQKSSDFTFLSNRFGLQDISLSKEITKSFYNFNFPSLKEIINFNSSLVYQSIALVLSLMLYIILMFLIINRKNKLLKANKNWDENERKYKNEVIKEGPIEIYQEWKRVKDWVSSYKINEFYNTSLKVYQINKDYKKKFIKNINNNTKEKVYFDDFNYNIEFKKIKNKDNSEIEIDKDKNNKVDQYQQLTTDNNQSIKNIDMYSNSDDMDDSDDHVIYDEDNDDVNSCTRLNSCQTKNINYTTELNNNKDQLEYKSINQNDLVNFSFKNKINNDSYINSKIYRAVNDVTFQINENECLSLLGPNGAGKTTTISMIMGKENITRGEIYFEDRRLHDSCEIGNTYSGLCPQYSTLWPSLNVKEILEFYLMIAGYSKKNK